jgi:hypothetical protein
MERISKIGVIAGLVGQVILTCCKPSADNHEGLSHPAIPVTISPARSSQMVTYLELNATSSFLLKSVIKAPVTGFIDDILVSPGDAVDRNQVLFTIKTKEASAIRDDSINDLKFTGIVNVKAATAGQISVVEHPKGDYVAEGDQLCQVAIPGSMVFILDVPFELSGFVRLNEPCEIALPDSQVLKGFVKSRFPSMEGNSQTERFIVRLATQKYLPENLVGKIRIVKESVKAAISLPKSCILTDEIMKSFWVMKLVNDSVAVKVPVTTGITEDEFVQITLPVFGASDLFLSSGNYGLGDTAFVKVIKNASHEP